MFTLENSINEIMSSETKAGVEMLIGTMMFRKESILSLIPNDLKDDTLRKVADTVKTPWGIPFPSHEIVAAANLSGEIFDETKWKIRTLWKEGEQPVFNNTKEDVCLFTPVINDGEKRPAVIICPGGAYMTLAMVSEGFDIANEFVARGYRPYILRYRRLPNQFPCQQEDLTLALLNVFANALKDGVDTSDIMILGFSAGGHLCASTVTLIEVMKEKVLQELEHTARKETYMGINPMPHKMVIGYAVTGVNTDLMENICPDKDTMDDYAPFKYVSSKLPKTYAWACKDDGLVPSENTVQWGEAMEAVGAESCYRIFPTGGHGIGTGRGTSAEGWLNEMFEFMK